MGTVRFHGSVSIYQRGDGYLLAGTDSTGTCRRCFIFILFAKGEKTALWNMVQQEVRISDVCLWICGSIPLSVLLFFDDSVVICQHRNYSAGSGTGYDSLLQLLCREEKSS